MGLLGRGQPTILGRIRQVLVGRDVRDMGAPVPISEF